MKKRTPSHLSDKSKHLWSSLQDEFEFDDAHFLLLELALTSFDRSEQARKDIEENGLYVMPPSGLPKINPAVKIEHDAGNRFLNAWNKLGFDEEAKREPGRPPEYGKVRMAK